MTCMCTVFNIHFGMQRYSLALIQTWTSCNLTQGYSSFNTNTNTNSLPVHSTRFCVQWHRNSVISNECSEQDGSATCLIQCWTVTLWWPHPSPVIRLERCKETWRVLWLRNSLTNVGNTDLIRTQASHSTVEYSFHNNTCCGKYHAQQC
jgi:hypothetical protein